MTDIQDKNNYPTLEEIGYFVQNPVFERFCAKMRERYQCGEKVEFSSCSWERGWNIKFKKSGKTLCTLYPREAYFTLMIVVGKKEKEAVEAILPECSLRLAEIYEQTAEGNGQRWLMVDIEDEDDTYRDVFRLIEIRRRSAACEK